MALNVDKLEARYQALREERTAWDAAWDDLAELFLPTRWRADTDENAHKKPKLNCRLVNSIGVLSIRVLAAGLHGGMTSPVRPWFRLTVPGEIDGTSGLNEWLDEVTQRMQFYLHQSNFYDCIHGLYRDLGTFGTALLIETADENGLHFDLVRAGEYVLDVNEKGVVDTFFRRFYMTARQIVEKWGDKSIPDNVLNAAKNNMGAGGQIRFNVIHGVFPREDARISGMGSFDMPYVSVYWIREGSGGNKASIIDEGGYKMFPAFAPRWDITGHDTYGRSPAMDVAPDVKMLQAMTTTLRKVQHKIADPPMLGDDSLRRYGVDRNPGGMTFGSFGITQGRPLIVPIQQPEAAALGYIQTAIDGVEEIVRTGLYVDLFRLMIDDNRIQITATEVQARQNEKMLLLGPVVERMHNELLSPLVKRTYQLMGEFGVLPDPPEGLEGMELDVHFESVLAQAQKILTTAPIDQGLAFVANISTLKPDAIDIIDGDKTVRSYLKRVGIPESCIADEQDVESIRRARIEAQQQQVEQNQMQQTMESMVDASAAAKNLGTTPIGASGETLMNTILGGMR